MTSMSSLLKPLALASLLAATTASQAAITVVTSLAAFNAATAAQGTDTFAGFSTIIPTVSPVVRTAGPYGYTAAAPGNFFGGGTNGNPFLSTTDAEVTITFSAFSAGVRGIGGNFFDSNISGQFAAGDITVSTTDGSGTVSQTIIGATASSFLGFVSDGPITRMTVVAVQPAGGGFLWPSVDNLTLAAAVPEPGTSALMLGGLGVLCALARRRGRPRS